MMDITTELVVSSVLPTVSYHVQDGLIEYVTENQPIPVAYKADDIFHVLARILDTLLDPSYEPSHTTTQLVEYLSSVLALNSTESEDVSAIFRNFLVLPLHISNARQITSLDDIQIDLLPKNMTVLGYIARDDYQIIFSRFAITTFTAIVGVTLVFCGIALFYCFVFGRLAPNVSDFGEIDFATKALSTPSINVAKNEMSVFLHGLGNARTTDIIHRLRDNWILVGEGEHNRVVMAMKSSSDKAPENLRKRLKYR